MKPQKIQFRKIIAEGKWESNHNGDINSQCKEALVVDEIFSGITKTYVLDIKFDSEDKIVNIIKYSIKNFIKEFQYNSDLYDMSYEIIKLDKKFYDNIKWIIKYNRANVIKEIKELTKYEKALSTVLDSVNKNQISHLNPKKNKNVKITEEF